MKNSQKGFVIPSMIVIVALIVVGGAVYLYNSNQTVIPSIPADDFDWSSVTDVEDVENDKIDHTSSSADIINNESDNSVTPPVEQEQVIEAETNEDIEYETFNNTLGKVISIKVIESNKWVLEVDLLTRNPESSPRNLDVPRYFNESPRIRNLYINENTKIYNCDFSNGNYYYTFEQKPKVDLMNNQIKRYKEEGEGELIENFDISGSNITAIHMLCAS